MQTREFLLQVILQGKYLRKMQKKNIRLFVPSRLESPLISFF